MLRLLRFVPYIGIWIAAILAVFLAAAIQPQWTMAVYTLILFIVVDLVAGQIAEPLLYGHRSGLSPLAVVVAAIFWSWLWGPIGLVLSTPLTLCVVTLGRYADRLNFLTVLLGDQPALTPAQTFYQRILADDPHEAIVQAERLLREMSLIDYYDKVALEGLKLARNDALRGVLMPEQLARINDALVDIVENLEIADGLPDRLSRTEPADSAWAILASASADLSERHDGFISDRLQSRHESVRTSVLCVPGRGAFDEVTTAIAVQLLGRQGLAPMMATHSGYRSAHARRTELQGRADHLHHLARRARFAAVSAQYAAAYAGMAAEGDAGGRHWGRARRRPGDGLDRRFACGADVPRNDRGMFGGRERATHAPVFAGGWGGLRSSA